MSSYDILCDRSKIRFPKISIIVAAKNCRAPLCYAIENFYRQTYQFKEMIIIDGGSTDGTLEMIQANEGKLAYWESAPDKGVYDAFNKALNHVTGDWVYFLGSDDFFWSPTVLETVASHLKSIGSNFRLVYGRVNHLTPGGKILRCSTHSISPQKIDFSKMFIDHQALFHHKSIFNDYGGFSLSYKIIADYEFLLRVTCQHREPFVFLPVTIAGHPYGGISTQRKNRFRIFREAEKIRKVYGVKIPIGKKIFKHLGALFWVGLAESIGENMTGKIEDWLLYIQPRITERLLRKRSVSS